MKSCMRYMAEIPTQHEARVSAVLALRICTEFFISHIAITSKATL